MKQYDYLIVGAGLFGSVFAHEAHKKGKKCLVIDRRNHTGGNIFGEEIERYEPRIYAHLYLQFLHQIYYHPYDFYGR